MARISVLTFLTNTAPSQVISIEIIYFFFALCIIFMKRFADVFLSDRRSQWFATTHSKAGHISRKSQ